MTTIEWVKNQDGTQGKTWNPVTGCTKVSPGCKNCYAERMARRLAGRAGYPQAPKHFDVTLHPDRLDIPLRRKRPTTYFVPSMGDLFHRDVPDDFICEVFHTMYRCPHHTFQVLTKRAERLPVFFRWATGSAGASFEWPLPNVWLGVSIESPEYSYRADYLRETPAAVRFISFEPLLASFADYPGVLDDMDWAIVGGESGPGARPMDPNWVRGIRDQCVAAGVPFFFKGWGAWAHIPGDTKYALPQRLHWWPDRNLMGRVGKKTAGRQLDGREWDEMPSVKEKS